MNKCHAHTKAVGVGGHVWLYKLLGQRNTTSYIEQHLAHKKIMFKHTQLKFDSLECKLGNLKLVWNKV
jgi:hypothetical protein